MDRAKRRRSFFMPGADGAVVVQMEHQDMENKEKIE
jgi:hypothetical protein